MYDHKIAQRFVQVVVNGLQSASVSTCSRWAMRYRVMGNPFPGPFSFTYHPWLREMHDDRRPLCVGKKAAQMGYTETMLNISFYALDKLHRDVMYVLPNATPDAANFSVARFDAALERSPYIANMFQNTKNVKLKRAGGQSLYVQGSRSRAHLKSIPAPQVILDEYEEFDEQALPLVVERMSGSTEKQLWMISTPLVPNYGIDKEYSTTDQRHFFFNCPSCNRLTELSYPESLVITADEVTDPAVHNSHYICRECRAVLPHDTKPLWLASGQWVPSFPSRETSGYYIPQLYSCTITPGEMAISALKSQLSAVDEQEFYNSKLGDSHVVANAVITDDIINSCIRNYLMDDPKYLQSNLCTTLGIDVGTNCNWQVTQYSVRSKVKSTDINQEARARVIAAGTFRDFEKDPDELMRKYAPAICVVDRMPETRAATRFARRWPGQVVLCHYGNSISQRDVSGLHPDGTVDEFVTVDRTSWLDQSLSRFKNGTIFIPKNLPKEYPAHIKALVRVYQRTEDKSRQTRATVHSTGEVKTFFQKTGDDHYAHANNYCEIGLRLCASLGRATNIEGSVI